MSFELTSGNKFCDCEIKAGNPIFALRGFGCFILNIQVSFSVFQQKIQRRLVNLSGSIYIESCFLGDLKILDGDSTIPSSVNNSIPNQQRTFQLTLSYSTIQEIEKNRKNEGVRFRIKISGNIFSIQPDNVNYFDMTYGSEEISYNIEQSKWIDFLRQWSYAPALNLEIVLDQKNPIAMKAGGYLLEAQNLYLSRQWKQSISECRHSLESLLKLLNPESISMKSISEKGESKNLQERILLSIASVKSICDLASHPSENSWTSEDALYVIRSTASIISRTSTLVPLGKE